MLHNRKPHDAAVGEVESQETVMGKIELNERKTLKLTNTLKRSMELEKESTALTVQVEQMQSYIRVKGARQIGPLIQYAHASVSEAGELSMNMELMLQCNHYIHQVEQPYAMDSVIRVPDCIYCRYTGPGEMLKFAYDKINLFAFENNIPLRGNSYTIFVDQNEEEGTLVADVFMERADGETD